MKLMNPFTLVKRTCQAAHAVVEAAEAVQAAAQEKKLIVVKNRDKKQPALDLEEFKDA